MSSYFFDFEANGNAMKDDTGTEFGSIEEMQAEARHALAAIARDDIAKDGETRTYKVLVHDKHQEPVYSVVMTLVGTTIKGSGAL